MSELIEKVKRILSDNECQKYSVTAPKVIRAVAEWTLSRGHTKAEGDFANFLIAQLKEMEPKP